MPGQRSPDHRLLQRDAQSGAIPQRTRRFLRSSAKRFEYAADRGLRCLATISVRCPQLVRCRAVIAVNRPPRCEIAALALPLRPYSRRDVTAAAVLTVLWPLARKPRDRGTGSDRLVYQDQLREIDRDRAAGLIGDAEAEAARIEISRRLLAAVDAENAPPHPPSSQANARRRRAASRAVVIVPLIA